MPVGTMDYSQTVFEQSFIGNCLKKSEKEECTTSKEVKEEELEAQGEVKEGQESEAEGQVLDYKRNPIKKQKAREGKNSRDDLCMKTKLVKNL